MSEKTFVVVRYRVKAGKEQEFRELFQPMIEASRSDEGCIGYDLHQAINDPALFVLYEAWESRAHLNDHAAKPHVLNFRAKAKDLMTEPSEVTLLRRS